MKGYKAAFAVITAGVLWGMISFFVRVLSEAGLDALQIAFVRMAVAAPTFTIAVAVINRKSLKIKLRDVWMFIGMGVVSIVLFNFCYFYTMVHSQTSVAVVLLYTSPIFIMLLSAVLFREKITLRKAAALVMTVAGCIFVAGLKGQLNITPGVFLVGIASGFFYGLYTIFGRYALEKYSPLTVTVYAFIFGLAGSAPISRPVEVVNIFAQTPVLILWGLGIGIICTVLPYFLYTWGLNRMESGKAAILVAAEPLVGTVIGMTFWHESHDIMKLAGIGLILASMIILELPEKKEITSEGKV